MDEVKEHLKLTVDEATKMVSIFGRFADALRNSLFQNFEHFERDISQYITLFNGKCKYRKSFPYFVDVEIEFHLCIIHLLVSFSNTPATVISHCIEFLGEPSNEELDLMSSETFAFSSEFLREPFYSSFLFGSLSCEEDQKEILFFDVLEGLRKEFENIEREAQRFRMRDWKREREREIEMNPSRRIPLTSDSEWKSEWLKRIPGLKEQESSFSERQIASRHSSCAELTGDNDSTLKSTYNSQKLNAQKLINSSLS
ncbi:uncharacterized protein MONOS_15138 [Monocercomonoides exilis]|uniref:uncharacterized protein n=1 Tax=Monocercomonoides exilis TaxID=2049356 RepID=UPI00355982A6|nr:hypothetical protein MONOS_15138 [Monocercomonoides exilis]|eukprot:MONOS_15138.1-p1 / transcript=MONOS_15138.1 / gene=MONOS_15138 / organism=Monocercomonoides_exilis_PA203 / gene_product=unspecified product / transcript_product=unspecified product / location=Mono_scaffold01153:8330-9451(+) / protein_length=256 / sequence_SO=supercontig / SO=protein_coding / is_pseudo=false